LADQDPAAGDHVHYSEENNEHAYHGLHVGLGLLANVALGDDGVDGAGEDLHGAREVVRAQELQIVHPPVLVVKNESHDREHVEDEAGKDVVFGDVLEFVRVGHVLLLRGQEAKNDIDDPETIDDLFQGLGVLLKYVHYILAARPI